MFSLSCEKEPKTFHVFAFGSINFHSFVSRLGIVELLNRLSCRVRETAQHKLEHYAHMKSLCVQFTELATVETTSEMPEHHRRCRFFPWESPRRVGGSCSITFGIFFPTPNDESHKRFTAIWPDPEIEKSPSIIMIYAHTVARGSNARLAFRVCFRLFTHHLHGIGFIIFMCEIFFPSRFWCRIFGALRYPPSHNTAALALNKHGQHMIINHDAQLIGFGSSDNGPSISIFHPKS